MADIAIFEQPEKKCKKVLSAQQEGGQGPSYKKLKYIE
jgi:hypothetical protein